MFKVIAEGLGQPQPTKGGKGYTRQFLFINDNGCKNVIRVFCDDVSRIAGDGPIDLNLQQDFFFLVK
jgi:hypothetical protein